MSVHIATIGPVPVSSSGVAMPSSQMTIQQRITSSSAIRIFPDPSNPNTANYPTLKQYLTLEAASGYQLEILNQTVVVTSNVVIGNGGSE